MPINVVYEAEELFNGTAGTPVAGTTDSDSNTWAALNNFNSVLINPGTTSAQPSGTTKNFAGVVNSLDNPNFIFDKPHWRVRMEIAMPSAACQFAFFAGVISHRTKDILAGGFASAGYGADPGATTLRVADQILNTRNGGGFVDGSKISIADRLMCGDNFSRLGDGAAYFADFLIDEFQAVLLTHNETLGSNATYFMGDHVLGEYLLTPAYINDNVVLPAAQSSVFPILIIASSLLGATGPAVKDITYTYFQKTPRPYDLIWAECGSFFIASLITDFRPTTFDGAGSTAPNRFGFSTYGPYVIFPRVQVRDVPIDVKMIVVDNTANSARLRIIVGPLTITVPPRTWQQYVIPTRNIPIYIDGGGSGSTVYFFSEVLKS